MPDPPASAELSRFERPELRSAGVTLGVALALELLARSPLYHIGLYGIVAVSLLAVVVYCAFYGGLRAGLVSAVLAILYNSYLLSLPGTIFQFSDLNLARAVVIAAALVPVAAVVGHLRERVDQLLAQERSLRSDAEAASDLSRRLQAVAAALNQVATPEEVAEVCVREGMAAMEADAGSLGVLVEEGGAFEVVYSRGFSEDVVERWRRFPVTRGRPLSDTVLTRTPVLLSSREEWELRYPDAAADLRYAGARAFAATPLALGGRVLAGLSFAFREERQFDEGERFFLAILGEQAAQAFERARLLDSERQARQAAERLQDLTAALSEPLTTTGVGDAAMEHGVAALGANAGVLAMLTAAGDELEIVGSIGYPPAACMGPGRRWPLGATIPIAEATRTGKIVCIGSPEAWGERYLGGYAPARNASAAWAAIPVVLDGRPVGALLWTYHAPHRFSAAEQALMETLARLCSQALERSRLLETERQARADAEEANRSKTEFLSAMSHELRTPLNAIAGYVELIEIGVHGTVTEQQLAALGRVRHAQQVLLSLINDVLNFARLEAGRLEIVQEPVSVAALLAEMEDLVGTQMAAKGLEYTCPPCDSAFFLLGDPERTRQILLNLLTNAIKFTETGGAVTISAADRGDQVAIHVRDTGHGIPPDKLATIFDPFVQIDRRRTEASQQGVGLGLAISRELARAMGGDILVTSQPGEGSTFSLLLPAAPAESIAVAEAAAPRLTG